MENQINTDKNEFYQIFELWAKYKHWWPWFVLSIAVCLGVAMFKYYTTPKRYKRTALVQILDSNRGRSDVTDAFGDRIAINMNLSVRNEVEAFKSLNLIHTVVRRLNLTAKYYQIKLLNEVDLYDRTPVTAIFPDRTENDSFSFRLEFEPDSLVVLSKFVFKNTKSEDIMRGKLKDTIHTPVGRVILSPTLHYGTQWEAISLRILKNSVWGETGSFFGKLSTSRASKDNSIIELSVKDTNTSRATNFLNMLMSVYDENWLKEKNKFAEYTSGILGERLPVIKRELYEIEQQLEQYKNRHLLTNVQSAGSLYTTQSSNYAGQIIDLNTQLSIIQFIREHLNQNDNITTLLPFNLGLNNASIERQILDYNTLLMERNGLIANSSENNPAVVQRSDRLQTIRKSISEAVDNQIVNLNMQLSGLKSQEERMTQQLASNPVQERQLLVLERERRSKEEQYLYLLRKKEENDMALLLEPVNTRIINPPIGSNTPVSPNKNQLLLIALFLGFGIPGSVIFGKEFINTKIRGKEDLEGLSVPLLGVIASTDKENQKPGDLLLVSETGRDMLNETFRMVRTNLNAVCDKDMKVIMFTSFEPGCGKTFTALNLAMSFALTGKKIALIDTDLRTTALSNIIESPESSRDLGICSYLTGAITYRQLLQFNIRKDRFYSGFDVFPVGMIPVNPAELLMSERFGKMLESLKKRYDYVFLDCTPLDIVTDATIVSKLVDLSVFIVREDHTDRRKLRDLEKTYKKGIFKNMHLILNDSKLNIAFNKYHTRYNAKVQEVAKQIRASERTKLLTEKKSKKKASGEMKQLTSGTIESQQT